MAQVLVYYPPLPLSDILGGLFNAKMVHHLADAPHQLQQLLPQKVDEVISVLQSQETVASAKEFLKQAFYSSSGQVYWGMVTIGVLGFLSLCILPRHFPILQDKS